jgi:ketosteroid isomerase-like protein
MTRKVGWAAVLLVLCWYSGRATALPSGGGREPDFKALQAEVDEAWGSLRAENAGKYYVKGPHNVFFDVAPFRYENWAAYQQGAQKLFLDPSRSLKITGKGDDRITRSGDTAWVTRTCHIAAEMKEGKPIELDCRHTVIWVRQAGRWLIAHEHVSVPLPG